MRIYVAMLLTASILIVVQPTKADRGVVTAAMQLEESGVDPDIVKQVSDLAAKSGNWLMRMLAIERLIELKQPIGPFLEDPHPRVRLYVAEQVSKEFRDESVKSASEIYDALLPEAPVTRDAFAKEYSRLVAAGDFMDSGFNKMYILLKASRALSAQGDFRALTLLEYSSLYPTESPYRTEAAASLVVALQRADDIQRQDVSNRVKRALLAYVRSQNNRLSQQLLIADIREVGGTEAIEILKALSAATRHDLVRTIADRTIRKLTDPDSDDRQKKWAKKADQLYQHAQRLAASGDVKTAVHVLDQALFYQPNHEPSAKLKQKLDPN